MDEHHRVTARLKMYVAGVTPGFLGITEVVMGQPRCVLTNIREKPLLDLLPSRRYGRVSIYLLHLSKPQAVRWVTMDMWCPYREVVRDALPQVRIVVDKFHVVRMANAGLDGVREQLRLNLSAKERKSLMHDRFLLLRHPHDLQPMEQVLVESWTRYLPLLGDAYQAKEVFFAIYEAPSQAVAERAYQEGSVFCP